MHFSGVIILPTSKGNTNISIASSPVCLYPSYSQRILEATFLNNNDLMIQPSLIYLLAVSAAQNLNIFYKCFIPIVVIQLITLKMQLIEI